MSSKINEILSRSIELNHNEGGALSATGLLELLQKMKMLRMVEMKLALEKKEGKIKDRCILLLAKRLLLPD